MWARHASQFFQNFTVEIIRASDFKLFITSDTLQYPYQILAWNLLKLMPLGPSML